MAVKVTFNRASLRLNNSIARQINGSTVRTKQLVNGFKRSGIPDQWREQVEDKLRQLSHDLLYVFGGEVTGVTKGRRRILGAKVYWNPLKPATVRYKQTDSFWHETGDLLTYAQAGLLPTSGGSMVRKMDVYPAKFKRGASTVEVRTLITTARFPEPFQSLVVYPFLQGKGNYVAAKGRNDYKILVNQALRGFIPEVSETYGRQLLEALRT